MQKAKKMSYKVVKNTNNTRQKEGNIAKILGFTLNSSSSGEVLKSLASRLESNKKIFVVTPNPEFLVFGRDHSWFAKILNESDFAIPDGIGLVWASRLLSQKPGIEKRVSGTDLMQELCKEAVHRGWSVYFLGGPPGVAESAAQKMKQRYPGLKYFVDEGPNLTLDAGTGLLGPQKEVAKVVENINRRSPDLLFVAFGMGKQEKFISDSWAKLNVRLAMGIGGAFDYISGKVPRAPLFVRKMGFEWLYRLLKQPWRIKRQLSLMRFVALVLRERFLLGRKPPG